MFGLHERPIAYQCIISKTYKSRQENIRTQQYINLNTGAKEIQQVKIVSEYDQEITQSQTEKKLWHREEEPLNHHETPGRQIKQSNQLSLLHQDDCNTRTDTKQRTTKHRTITDSHNGSNNKQKVNNKRTTALERTAA